MDGNGGRFPRRCRRNADSALVDDLSALESNVCGSSSSKDDDEYDEDDSDDNNDDTGDDTVFHCVAKRHPLYLSSQGLCSPSYQK